MTGSARFGDGLPHRRRKAEVQITQERPFLTGRPGHCVTECVPDDETVTTKYLNRRACCTGGYSGGRPACW
jgi:hypothetical protein